MNQNITLAENTLGQRIKAQRIRMHMTQEELAEIMCVPKSTISAYENDKVDIKSSVLLELSEFLSTEPNYLLGYGKGKADNDEQDIMDDAILSMLNRINDEKIKDLLMAQIKAAANLYS